MAPSPDQISGLIITILAIGCVGFCLVGGLVHLIFRFARKGSKSEAERERDTMADSVLGHVSELLRAIQLGWSSRARGFRVLLIILAVILLPLLLFLICVGVFGLDNHSSP